MTRCFLAFEFEPASLEHLRKKVEPLHRMLVEEEGWALRLVRPENWHVTLLYFHDLAAGERRTVWRAAERAAAGGTWRELEFRWRGLALWPSARRPSLVCVEAEPYPGSADWPLPIADPPFDKGDVAHYLAYRPHATLMRFRRGGRKSVARAWRELQDGLPRLATQRLRMDRLSMFLSTLSAEQPVYPREYSVPLR